MFRTRHELVRALERLPQPAPLVSTSLIVADRRGSGPKVDPFGPGFLTSLETRTELLMLLRGLDERSRRLLVGWYVQDRPVVQVARDLKVSRVHCYRLRDKALDAMLEASAGRDDDVAKAS